MSKKAIFYAQSGGVTAVINATACGVIEAARENKSHFGKVYAGKNGILGALKNELIDTSHESAKNIAALRYTPGGAFGSCRYKLKSIQENHAQYETIIKTFKKYNIGYFFYNGGGDSQDTTLKISQVSQELGYPLVCIGLPKTVDNDLCGTDNSPGFGSVAKYIAVSIKEASLDVASMCSTSTKVFIMEVMGRHAGWIAAASGLSARQEGEAPHIILFPEIVFNEKKFLQKVQRCVKNYGFCAIVVSEGLRNNAGKFISEAGTTDAFGHSQLGGLAPIIAKLIKDECGYKYHWAVSDYLQRAARHIASSTDVEQAYAIGRAAIEFALAGNNAVMATIVRKNTKKYSWTISQTSLQKVANREKSLPRNFITRDGYGITQACRDYLQPLILGEAYPPYKNGLPDYVVLKNKLAQNKDLT